MNEWTWWLLDLDGKDEMQALSDLESQGWELVGFIGGYNTASSRFVRVIGKRPKAIEPTADATCVHGVKFKHSCELCGRTVHPDPLYK